MGHFWPSQTSHGIHGITHPRMVPSDGPLDLPRVIPYGVPGPPDPQIWGPKMGSEMGHFRGRDPKKGSKMGHFWPSQTSHGIHGITHPRMVPSDGPLDLPRVIPYGVPGPPDPQIWGPKWGPEMGHFWGRYPKKGSQIGDLGPPRSMMRSMESPIRGWFLLTVLWTSQRVIPYGIPDPPGPQMGSEMGPFGV